MIVGTLKGSEVAKRELQRRDNNFPSVPKKNSQKEVSSIYQDDV
jgi:hypothetical protein